MKKRILSLILCFGMILSFFPSSVYADQKNDEELVSFPAEEPAELPAEEPAEGETALAEAIADEPMEAGVPVDAEHFPDDNFRAVVAEYDTDCDGSLSDAEIAEVGGIFCDHRDIVSLEGLEYFSSTWSLYCMGNQLTSVDFSQNPALTWIDCSGNQLTELDVSALTDLNGLMCGSNQLTELDVSANSRLGLLDCDYNLLSALNLSNNPLLTTLRCYANGIASLNVSNCEYLVFALQTAQGVEHRPYYVEYVAEYDPEYGPHIELLVPFDTILTPEPAFPPAASENVVELNSVNFPDDAFRDYVSSEFDSDSNGWLSQAELALATSISCADMGISSLQGIEYFTDLDYLDCHGNQLSSLDLSQLSMLTYLHVSSNQLTTLDLSANTKLQNLYCSYNQLSSLDLSGLVDLEILYCEDNQLSELDTSANPNLNCLYCSSNEISSLELSQNEALVYLDCGYNQISALNVTANTQLKHLSCIFNQLSALDVSANTALSNLWCYGNQIGSLDLSNCPELVELLGSIQAVYDADNGYVEWHEEDWSKLLYIDPNTVLTPAPAYPPELPDNCFFDLEELTSLCAASYNERTVWTYLGSSDLELTEDLTIPENLILEFNAQALVIPEGVTLTMAVFSGLGGNIIIRGIVIVALGCLTSRLETQENGLVLYPNDRIIESFAELKALCQELLDPDHDTGIGNVYYVGEGPLTIEEDLTTPGELRLYFSCRELFVPAGVTLENHGYLDCATVRVAGFLNNYGHLELDQFLLEGEGSFNLVEGSYAGYHDAFLFTSFEELKALLTQDWPLYATLQYSSNDEGLTISEDVTIPQYVTLLLGSSEDHLVIPEGVTVTNYGEISLLDAAGLKLYGSLINYNALVFSHIDLGGQLDNQGWASLQRNVSDFEDLADAMSYGDLYEVSVRYEDWEIGRFEITQDLTIPEDCSFTLNNTGLLIPEGITLNVEGSLDTDYIEVAGTLYIGKDAEYTWYSDETVTETGAIVRYQPVDVVEINAENFPDDNFRACVSETCDADGNGWLNETEIEDTTYLNCSYQEISSLQGVEYLTALRELHCFANQLTELDVSCNTELTALNFSENNLNSIDVSANKELRRLYCYSNQLTVLDVSANTQLYDLRCNDNPISELDLSNCPNLVELLANIEGYREGSTIVYRTEE